MIEEMVDSEADEDTKAEFKSRLENAKDWKNRKLVGNPTIGSKVDIQTKEYVWMVATVKKIVIRNRGKIFFSIHYEVNIYGFSELCIVVICI